MRTLADLQDRLRAYVGNDPSQSKSTAVIQAAAAAVEHITSRAAWNFYTSIGRVITSIPYSTGTIAVDVTGGAYERMVTLTTGTWPTWAAMGTIVIANLPYDVLKRISDTVLVLRSNTCPSEDVAAGTSYTLYQWRYDLPTDFAAIQKPMVLLNNTQCQKVSFERLLQQRNQFTNQGTPSAFALMHSEIGTPQILFWPPPQDAYTCEFEYKRRPAVPVLVKEQAGTIALTSGSAVVTGTATAFKSSMVGAVLRVSYDNQEPTAIDGVNPYESEYLIDGYTSTTSLTLSSPATSTVTKRAYTISSRLDVMDGPMFNYLCQIGRRMLRQNLRINMLPGEGEDYERAKMEAMSADGEQYSGSDQAVVGVCSVPHYGSSMLTRGN